MIAGAPGAFTATVNGAPVALPPGNQAPFTLDFQSRRPRRPEPSCAGRPRQAEDVEQEGETSASSFQAS